MAADGDEHTRLLQLEQAAYAEVEQYGKCSLADKARVQKLSLAIQDRLARIRALTRDLELLVEELDSDEEQHEVAAQLAQHKAEYARIQAVFKQAALAQRTAVLRSAAEERKELLAGADVGLRQRKAQTEADAAALAEDVTGGLRRTRQVLAEELEHTGAALAAMETSHTALGKTRDEYHGQHRHLRRSKGLLGTLNWQAKSETYMLWIGLTFFLLVCAYIFQKRAAHFVPDALKPATLLGGLTGSGSKPVGMPVRRAPPPRPRPRPPSPPVQQPSRHLPPEDVAPHVAAEEDEAAGWAPPYTPPLPRTSPEEPEEQQPADEGNDAVWPAPAPELEQQLEQQQQQQQEQEQPREPEQPEEVKAEQQPAHGAADAVGAGEQPPYEPLRYETPLYEQQPGEQHVYEQIAYDQQPDEQHAYEPPAVEQPAEQAQQAEAETAEAAARQAQEQPATAKQVQRDEVQHAEHAQQAAAHPEEAAEAADEAQHAEHAQQAADEPGPEAEEVEEASQSPAEEPAEEAPAEGAAGVAEDELDVAELAAAAEALEEQGLAADSAGSGEAEAHEPAVGPEGSPEPEGWEAAAAAEAAAAEAAAAEADAQPGVGTIITDRKGRRIAVDGPDFVRHKPVPPPVEPEQQAELDGGGGDEAAADGGDQLRDEL